MTHVECFPDPYGRLDMRFEHYAIVKMHIALNELASSNQAPVLVAHHSWCMQHVLQHLATSAEAAMDGCEIRLNRKKQNLAFPAVPSISFALCPSAQNHDVRLD